MRGKEGKLRVKVARHVGLQALHSKESFSERHVRTASSDQPAEQVLSDEEVAWRLHQELNATSPMLRTRSRKAPEVFPAQKSSGGGGERKGQPIGSQEGAKGRSGKGAPAHSVNKASQSQDQLASGAESDEQLDKLDSLPKPAKSGGHAAVAGSVRDEECQQKVQETGAVRDEQMEVDMPQQLGSAGKTEPDNFGRAGCEIVLGGKSGSAAGGEAGDNAPAQHLLGDDGTDGSSPSGAVQGTSFSEEAALHGGMDTSSGDELRATRSRHAATEAGDDAHLFPGAAQGQGEQQQHAQQAAEKGKPQKPARPLKIPKLPMVRQEDGRWYRARLLRDAGDKVSLEFTGFEHQFPPIWLPRDSDRIWRGSYKGKDWKHLGGGSWEPKVKGGGRRAKANKRKHSEKKGSDDGAHSSGAFGPSIDDSHDHSDEEDFDEAESGHEKKPALLTVPPSAHSPMEGTAAAEPAALVKEELHEVKDEEMGEPEEPTRKKARRSNSRKRLDPIVREALMAAEQGSPGADDSDDQPGPSNQLESTPIAWKGSGKRAHRTAAHLIEDAAMLDAEHENQHLQQHVLPHLTPTPETPVTRLGKRMSLTPGTYEPLSPRAAAAAAAAIEAAGSPRHRQQQVEPQQEERDVPASPRRQQAASAWVATAATSVVSPRARSAYAHDESSPNEPPLSPRQRSLLVACTDGPSSPRHRQRPMAAVGDGSLSHRPHSKATLASIPASGPEEEGESRDGHEAKGRRPRRHMRVFADQHGSDDEEAAEDGTGSESQEEEMPKRRPRRQQRKAAIYKDVDFAFGEEAEEAEPDVATTPVGLEPAGMQEPAQPARRRRKPVVSSPAPTDVGNALSSGGRRSALPAALAALDVLPTLPAAAPSQDGRELAGAGDAVASADADEAAAVAALADLPSPRAGQEAQHHPQVQHYHRRQPVEEVVPLEDEEAEGDDGDDDYAPPVRRRDALIAAGAVELPLRKRSNTLPLSLEQVRTGRVHKLHASVAPLSRHYSLTYGDRQLSSTGRRPAHYNQHPNHDHTGTSTRHRIVRSSSSAEDREGGSHHQRRGGSFAMERSSSLGLDGISVAQGMFGTILSALKKCSLEDSLGGILNDLASSGRHGCSLSSKAGVLHGLERQMLGSAAGGGGSRGRLHLFSSAWSYSKWHSNGSEPHPSILTLQSDLFNKACAENGSSSVFSMGLPAASNPPLRGGHPKPPLPLFC